MLNKRYGKVESENFAANGKFFVGEIKFAQFLNLQYCSKRNFLIIIILKYTDLPVIILINIENGAVHIDNGLLFSQGR